MQPQRAALLATADEEFRRELAASVCESGLAVIEAGSAAESLERWRDDVGVLFLDASLADGATELLARAREAGVPVQAAGAASQGEELLGLLKAGARGYLLLPRPARAVADELRRILAREEERPFEDTGIGRAKRELEAAFDTFPSALLVVGPDLRVRRANATAVALSGGGSFGDVRGRAAADVLGVGDDDARREIADAVRANRDADLEFEVPGRPGQPASGSAGARRKARSGRSSPKLLHLRVFGRTSRPGRAGPEGAGGAPVPVEAGTTDGSLILVEDVTLRRREEAVRAHQQQLEAVTLLAASLSHEINQPLNTILGRAQLAEMILDQDGLDRDQLRQNMEEIVACVRRVSEILKKLHRVTDIVTKPYLDDTLILDIERSAGDPGRR